MPDTDFEFAHTELAQSAIMEESQRLISEEGIDPNDSVIIAAATLDGAGDRVGKTVESIQTCRDLFGKPVKGLTTDDSPLAREDLFAESEKKRRGEAEAGVDYAALWLTVSQIPYGGMDVAKEMSKLVNQDESNLERIMKNVKAMVDSGLSDAEIVGAMKKILKI